MSGCNPSGYTVKCIHTTCPQCSPFKDDFRICKEPQCVFLCPHMYICDSKCYDYTNDHVCKHIHRVHSLFHQSLPRSPTAPEIDINGPDDNISYELFDLHIIKPLQITPFN